jgi:hypothetical protein
MPSGSPSVSLSQFFVAAAKRASEEGKTALPVIDVTAEPVTEEKVEW